MMVDVRFTLQGKAIPADHGYTLYSAICRLIPELHQDKDIAILSIYGQVIGNRQLAIIPSSHLIIRLSSDRIKDVLPLAGKRLDLDGESIRVGVPQTTALIPSARLYSRLVIIKGFMEPQPFLEAVQRKLNAMGIKGTPSLVEQPELVAANQRKKKGTHSPFLRRTICIHDKEVVGFAVRVESLTAEESIRLQEQIGMDEATAFSRRRFGCGIFVPERR